MRPAVAGRVVLGFLLALVVDIASAIEPASHDDGDELELEFVLIPAGTFVMGSPLTEWGCHTDETQHRVTISRPFYLSTTEVTQAQFRAVVGKNPSYLYDCSSCPVEGVSWFDAIVFCNAFSQQAGATPVYTLVDTTVSWNPSADGFRLPTEAEWEYACRAGTTTVFNTGDCLDTDQANYLGYDPQKGCAKGLWRGQTIDVASFAPNAWGLYDMHGNVSEWCWDRHGFFRADPVTDPLGKPDGTVCVLRGGSFQDLGRDCRSARRATARPDARFRFVGLRLARTAPPDAR